MSKYRDWMLKQDLEFIKEVCGDVGPDDKFKDYKFRSITLEELKELDDKFINCVSEKH